MLNAWGKPSEQSVLDSLHAQHLRKTRRKEEKRCVLGKRPCAPIKKLCMKKCSFCDAKDIRNNTQFEEKIRDNQSPQIELKECQVTATLMSNLLFWERLTSGQGREIATVGANKLAAKIAGLFGVKITFRSSNDRVCSLNDTLSFVEWHSQMFWPLVKWS